MVCDSTDTLAMENPVQPAPEDAPALTPLQHEILVLVTNGLTNQEIAVRLNTTPGRIGTQIGRIVQRLGLTCRAEVAVWAAQQGLYPRHG